MMSVLLAGFCVTVGVLFALFVLWVVFSVIIECFRFPGFQRRCRLEWEKYTKKKKAGSFNVYARETEKRVSE